MGPSSNLARRSVLRAGLGVGAAAGLAGLAAARAVVAAGREVVVLEARDRVGGRTLNHQLEGHPGVVVEVGGQWIGPTQTRMVELAAELGIETFPTHDEGENVIEWRGRLKRYRGPVARIARRWQGGASK